MIRRPQIMLPCKTDLMCLGECLLQLLAVLPFFMQTHLFAAMFFNFVNSFHFLSTKLISSMKTHEILLSGVYKHNKMQIFIKQRSPCMQSHLFHFFNERLFKSSSFFFAKLEKMFPISKTNDSRGGMFKREFLLRTACHMNSR